MTGVVFALGVVLRVVCAVLAVTFVLRYLRYDWRATAEGRHILGFTAILALFLVTALGLALFGRPWWVPYPLAVMYAVMAYVLWRRNMLLGRG